MNKFTKAAVASGAGVVLLLGGAGSLAYWNASADLSGGTVDAGLLTIEAAGPGSWSEDLGSFVAVPGDELSFTQELTLTGEGDNLWVQLGLGDSAIQPAVDGDAEDEALALALGSSASFEVDGASYTAGTPFALGSDAVTIEVTVTVTFPFGSAVDNSTQTGSASFADFAVVATQVVAP